MNIGDEVRIIDTRVSYPTYDKWVENNAPEYSETYARVKHMPINSIGEVVAIAEHELEHRELYLVANVTGVILISREGIELASKKRYSTWEILKELKANPRRKFIESNGLVVGVDSWGFLTSDNKDFHLSIEGNWEGYNEQVSFGEAFLAFTEDNRDIYCLYNGDSYIFFANPLVSNVLNEDWIASGEWYIKY